jgi:hypothetical protein
MVFLDTELGVKYPKSTMSTPPPSRTNFSTQAFTAKRPFKNHSGKERGYFEGRGVAVYISPSK